MTLLATLSRTAGRVHPDPGWGDQLARLKYCARALLTPGRSTAWFERLAAPELADLVRAHPRLYSKLQRPYLHRRVTVAKRLHLLREHYRFVGDALDASRRREVSSVEGLNLAELPASDPARYSLRLRYDDQFEKEGELTLALQDAVLGEAIFTLSFTVTNWQGGDAARSLFVGGIQGRRGANDRDEIVALTRSMHGLRPKALLVFAVQSLAEAWEISEIRAVGDSEHIYRHFRKRREIRASYDEFWAECQGARNDDGNYTLPSRHLVRALDAIPSNKRSLYRKRYAMLEALGGLIRQGVVANPQRAAEPHLLPSQGTAVALRQPLAELEPAPVWAAGSLT